MSDNLNNGLCSELSPSYGTVILAVCAYRHIKIGQNDECLSYHEFTKMFMNRTDFHREIRACVQRPIKRSTYFAKFTRDN